MTNQVIFYTPNEIASMTVAYLRERQANKAVSVDLGLPVLDEIMNPVHPGDLVSVLGRPGSGKSSFMIRWARYRSERLYDIDDPDRMVVYITLEQTVEDLYAYIIAAETGITVTDMARANLSEAHIQKILGATVRTMTRPLTLLGHSAQHRRARPSLAIETIRQNLHQLEDRGTLNGNPFRLDMIFMDYLQRAPYKGDNKSIGLYDVMNGCKELALEFACPFVLGVQAQREVDETKMKIPGLSDAQWTSGVEQVSDIMLSLMRPAKYFQDGQTCGSITVNGPNQMLVTVVKQKLGSDNQARWIYFNPATNIAGPLEGRYD